MDALLKRIRTGAATTKSDSVLFQRHPELVDRIPMLRLSSDDVAGAQRSDYQMDVQLYSSHQWTRRAVDILANAFAPLPQRVVRGVGRDAEPLDDHPVSCCWQCPILARTPRRYAANGWSI